MDFDIEQWVNGPAGSHAFWDAVMKAAAGLAEVLFIAVVGIWFALGWLSRRRDERRGAIAALLAAGGALLVNQVISHVWARPRPYVAHPSSVHLLLTRSADPSFPSDHAAAAFAIAIVLIAFHRRLGVVAMGFAAFMSYARVYVGSHYPGDVLGGAVVGVIVAVLLLTWLQALPNGAARISDRAMERLHLLRAGGTR